eukprot:m51a1_g9817 hypothetical protein (501) ;mRNA; f:1870647-1885170
MMQARCCTPRTAFVAVPLAVALAVLLSQGLLRPPPASTPAPAPATASTTAAGARGVLLLAWTQMYGQVVGPRMGHCGNGLWWASTPDRTALGAADALVFHARDINASDMPAGRDPMQPWVLTTVESPVSDAVLFDRTSNATRAFNLTSTYEWGSDVWWPYVPHSIEGLVAPVVPTRLRRKSAPILWVASNCWASNQRQFFVQKLMKYVRIDSLGPCLRNAKWPNRTVMNRTEDVPFRQLVSQYKFYLTFENSECVDYATTRTVVLLLSWTTMYRKTVPPAVGHCGNGLWWASTSDRAALGAADALVFHARDINASDMPAARDPMQPWVLATVESPVSDKVKFDRTSNATRAFNLTSTYEWGSDGWWPYAPTDIASIMAPVVPTRLRRKSAPILWVASNCWASNHRQVFIERLMKFVKIDSLGSCLHNAQWPNRTTMGTTEDVPLEELVGQYKFYLTFENSDTQIKQSCWSEFKIVDGKVQTFLTFEDCEHCHKDKLCFVC